ncbi:hypothetical protein AGMMS50218_07750 [Actinomycetota bacterium]|nr:hypothetical protein AGMMS50218_07750 [Actinomycetota bacterium]
MSRSSRTPAPRALTRRARPRTAAGAGASGGAPAGSAHGSGGSGRPPRWLPRALAMAVAAAWIGILAWRGFAQLGTVLTIIAISWFISLALDPAVAWLVQRRVRRTRATGLVMIASIVAVVGVAWVFGDLFIRQLVQLVASTPALYESVRADVGNRFDVVLPESDDLVTQVLQRWGDDLATTLIGFGGSVASVLFIGSAVLLVTYYMTSSGPRFRAAVCRTFTPNRQVEILRVWEVAQDKVSGFLTSRIVLAVLSTVATFVFLTVVGVPYALPLAAFTGVVSQFVPTIGTYIGGALPVVVALANGVGQAVAVLIFIVAYQQLENLVLAPRVSARSMELNPAVSFLAVLGFGALFGALGAFLALPVAATIQAASSTYVRRHDLVDSAMLDDPDAPQPHGTGRARGRTAG